jgi:hypothetical protein
MSYIISIYCIMLPETAQAILHYWTTQIPLYDAQKQASRDTNAVTHELITQVISTVALILLEHVLLGERFNNSARLQENVKQLI